MRISLWNSSRAELVFVAASATGVMVAGYFLYGPTASAARVALSSASQSATRGAALAVCAALIGLVLLIGVRSGRHAAKGVGQLGVRLYLIARIFRAAQIFIFWGSVVAIAVAAFSVSHLYAGGHGSVPVDIGSPILSYFASSAFAVVIAGTILVSWRLTRCVELLLFERWFL